MNPKSIYKVYVVIFLLCLACNLLCASASGEIIIQIRLDSLESPGTIDSARVKKIRAWEQYYIRNIDNNLDNKNLRNSRLVPDAVLLTDTSTVPFIINPDTLYESQTFEYHNWDSVMQLFGLDINEYNIEVAEVYLNQANELVPLADLLANYHDIISTANYDHLTQYIKSRNYRLIQKRLDYLQYLHRITMIRQWDSTFKSRYEVYMNPSVLYNPKSTADSLVIVNNAGLLTNMEQEGVDTLSKRSRKLMIKYSAFYDEWDDLFAYLQFDENIHEAAVIEANVSYIECHKTLQYLLSYYQSRMDSIQYMHVAASIKERNYRIIQKRLAEVESKEFIHYSSTHATRKAVKEIDFYMDNDAFVFVPGDFNQDREYTGGGAITVSTDYFDGRWLNLGWLRYIGSKDRNKPYPVMLSYQSLSLGMNFFTPYIRYRNNYDLADTLFQHDRPFSSYVHIDRNKYRLWPKGLVRHSSSFQIGVIGTNIGRDIQALLHRDAIVSSQRVYGWDKQIANGGRWLIQYNNYFDFLLFSTTNNYKSVFDTRGRNSLNRCKNIGANIIGTSELLIGGQQTALGAGITLSTNDFTASSGQKSLRKFKQNSIYEFAFSFECGMRYRYIIHNSLLEGFGYLRTFIDDAYDNESGSVYTLNREWYNQQNANRKETPGKGESWTYDKTPSHLDQLNRNMLYLDLRFNLRWRKMILYYHLSFHTKEYTVAEVNYSDLSDLVAEEDQVFYDTSVIPELTTFNDRKYYGFGRIGITWLLY